LQQLAQFTAAAMASGVPEWSRDHVVRVAKEFLREFCDNRVQDAYDKLQLHYGFVQKSKFRLSSVPDLDEEIGRPLRITGTPAAWGAPAFAALFSALGLSFFQIKERLQAAKSQMPKPTSRDRLLTLKSSLTVAEAKAALLQRIEAGRTLHMRESVAFWSIYFADRDWLLDAAPELLIELRVPGFEEDRLTFLAGLKRGVSFAYFRPKSTWARIMARDRVWLEELKAASASAPPNPADDALQAHEISALNKTFEKLKASQTIAARISLPKMAAAMGKTLIEVRSLLSRHPSFAQMFEAFNEDYPTRRIEQMLANMVKNQEHMTVAEVVTAARFNSTRRVEFKALVERIARRRPEWMELLKDPSLHFDAGDQEEAA